MPHRQAEIRDIADLDTLFMKLMSYILTVGSPDYQKDYRTLRNAVVAYLSYKVMDENSLVLVREKDGVIDGFLVGTITTQPAFYEHNVMGQIEWLYPVAIQMRGAVREFERWAQGRGATAGMNTVIEGNDRASRVMQIWGLRPTWKYMLKPYGSFGQ